MATTTRKTAIKYRRGKPMPVLKHGDVIDLTTFPLRSKPRTNAPILQCSKCGRKGERSRYGPRGGPLTTESFTHSIRYESLFWMVLDSCTLVLDPPVIVG